MPTQYEAQEQVAWITALREQGYAAGVCYSWKQASEVLMQYLSGNIEPIEQKEKNENANT